MNIKKTVSCLTAALFLGGCSMAPKYERPEMPVPATWPGARQGQEQTIGSSENPASDIPWSDFFMDEKLRQVISLALENNRDLKIAALNMERSRALYRIEGADLLPQIDADITGSRQRLAEGLSSSGRSETLSQYSVGLGVISYELDLFGRIRSLKEQALEQYLATMEARRTAQISLVAQVAAGYMTLAADMEKLALARETLKSQESAYGLIERRLQLGASSELDLRQAQTRVDAARIDIARFTTLVAQDKNALTLLTGASVPIELLPQHFPEKLTALKEVPPTLPSTLLLSRPDVMEAENLLKGFNAHIGAARAAYFPTISLTGSAGFGSDELSELFASGSDRWSFSPKIVLPIFDGGRRSADLKVAKTDRDIAVARYEKTVQNAFREVADELARQKTIEDETAARQSLAEAAEASYELSRIRYEKGVDSYLSVLDSQRLLYAARQELITIRLVSLLNRTSLYKVLGGGVK